ncbi:possible tyrosine transporter P-protein (TC 2.A.45.2.1) [Desulfotomaculum arcticum]|uniref:Possible tyrosine transporter P-protein (TC 2.A.45.2.1) n=1 Tax=Desulfotruncus arcticus DSM 17038 TaxID=1121424 RepID=A0A1I2YPY0_9FIRM|nr:ArsB/NhaD family transporter [Desulfotruncus arcticus]SFH27116.1 possible tyrosine transporter P-protein (TC 2.A.45.2.1) [Desulfotomaculum arcticum] [Desulfotruncus arcticus DSM 17038]
MSDHIQFYLAAGVFLTTYIIIISEKIHRTVIALFGASFLVVFKILSPEEATHHIDFNTIGLLVGMMIIVGITRQTGIFEYLAIKAAKISQGQPLKIMAALSLVTAVLSALLDNVTTVMLIVPITFAIAQKLRISPIPILIAEILSSNIGGTATLIGDPPNIMIGSATHLGFMDFVINLTPVIILVYVVNITLLRLIYRSQLSADQERQKIIMELEEKDELKNLPLLRKCLLVIGLTMLGFVLHQHLNMESSVIALTGAGLLLLISGEDPEHALHAVEWPVIFFFIGLFVLVGGLVKVGIISSIAQSTMNITGGTMIPTSMLILWLSGIASAFVDNIPFVATMIPMIHDMGQMMNISDPNTINLFWWSLSLGACLGGNGTIIGASANVVVIGMAEKRSMPITFMQFFKIGFPLMLLSLVICAVYLVVWHFFGDLVTIIGTSIFGVLLILASIPINKSLNKLRIHG